MATYFVATWGNNTSPGTLTSPFQTPSHGLSVLAAGDTLYFLDGIFTTQIFETGFGATGTGWAPGDFITVAGYPGATAVFRPSGAADNIVRFQDATVHHVLLKDLIIDGAGITVGAGPGSEADVYLADTSHDIRFENVEIKDSYGNGVLGGGSNHRFTNMNVHGAGREPTAIYSQGHNGMYLSVSDSQIIGGQFWNNKSIGVRIGSSSALISASNNSIVRARFFQNGAGYGLNGTSDGGSQGGGVLLADVNNTIVNCPIYRNQVGLMILGFAGKTATGIQAYHNTIANNGDRGVWIQMPGFPTTVSGAEIKNTIIQGNGTDVDDNGSGTVLSDNLSSDPQFLNPSVGDFRLRSTSAAIDVAPDLGVTSDCDGLARPYGTAADIGAFEWGSTTPVDDFVPSPRTSISFVNGSGTWTTPATSFDHTGQASATTYNPPSGSTALASQNVLAWIACGLGDGEIHEVYGSDGAEGEEPKRRLIGWDEGTILGPESTGWPHAERYRIVGDIQQYGFYARGLPLKHHRDGVVTFAWNGCGPSDVDGLLIDQAFRMLLVFLNEVVELNDGEGYRNGTYGQAPIETFADGTPKFKTSKFEEAQEQTVTWLTPGSPGALGYVGTIVVTEPTPLAEVIRRFFSDYGGHLTANHRGQVYPFLINPEPADGAGRLYRERMEIARLVDHRFAKEERENRIVYSYDYNFDTQAFRNLTITTDDAASITAAGGERIGVFATSPKTCYYANDKDTIEDRWARHLTLYAYSPRYVQWATHLKSLADANGDPARFSHRKEGLGLTGETGSPGVILHTTETEHPPEVLQTAMIFRAAAITAANLVADDTGTPLTTEDGSAFLLVDGA